MGKFNPFAENPAAGESHELVFFDSAFKDSKLERILAHELAHEVFLQLPSNEKKAYADTAGWIFADDPSDSKQKILIPGRDPGQYVAEDGSENVNEDFANNIEYFLFEGKTLLTKTPKVHQSLDRKYGDKLLKSGLHQ